jgi:hypothetical protein
MLRRFAFKIEISLSLQVCPKLYCFLGKELNALLSCRKELWTSLV